MKRDVLIKYDIKDLYPTISEEYLLEALISAKAFINITPEKLKIFLRCRKLVHFHNNVPFQKATKVHLIFPNLRLKVHNCRN